MPYILIAISIEFVLIIYEVHRHIKFTERRFNRLERKIRVIQRMMIRYPGMRSVIDSAPLSDFEVGDQWQFHKLVKRKPIDPRMGRGPIQSFQDGVMATGYGDEWDRLDEERKEDEY